MKLSLWSVISRRVRFSFLIILSSFYLLDVFGQLPGGEHRFNRYQLLSIDRTEGLNFSHGNGPPLSLVPAANASQVVFERIPFSQYYAIKLIGNDGRSEYLGLNNADGLYPNYTFTPFLFNDPNNPEDIKYMWKITVIGGDQLEIAHPITTTRSNHPGYKLYRTLSRMPKDIRYAQPYLNLIVGVLRQGTAMLYRSQDNQSNPTQVNYADGLWVLQRVATENGVTDANRYLENSWQYTNGGMQSVISINPIQGGWVAYFKTSGYATKPQLLRSFPTSQTGVKFQFVINTNQSLEFEVFKTADGTVMANITDINMKMSPGPYQVRLLSENPTAADLQSAVQRKDMEAVNMMISKGLPTDVIMLNNAVRAKDKSMISALMKVQAPDQNTFIAAADVNDTETFRAIGQTGLRLNNDQPALRAIDLNNFEILKMSLAYGANSANALSHAVNSNNTTAVEVCVASGAPPDQAVPFAVRTNNMALYTTLLTSYPVNKDAALGESIHSNNLDMTKLALNKGANPNAFVTEMANNSNDAMTLLLLDYKGDPNLAMPAYVSRGNLAMVNNLIKRGASANSDSYVSKATELNNVDLTKLLVEKGGSPQAGMTNSVANGNLQITEYLISKGANAKGYIQIPSAAGNYEMVNALLKHGADANKGMAGSVQNNHNKIVSLLLESNASPNGYLPLPSERGNMDMVTMLVNKGANPNEGMNGGVNGNQTAVVKYLLDKGAGAKGYIGTPSGRGNMEMVSMLLDKGADPNKGMPPAVDNGRHLIVEKLISSGADAKPEEFMYTSVVKKYPDLIRVLSKNGGKVNFSRNGSSLLHIACDEKENQATVKALIDAKADVNARDSKGETPLHVAANGGNKNLETVVLLFEAGGNVNACDAKGKSVFQRANGGKVKDFLKDKGAEKKC